MNENPQKTKRKLKDKLICNKECIFAFVSTTYMGKVCSRLVLGEYRLKTEWQLQSWQKYIFLADHNLLQFNVPLTSNQLPYC
jgi:hypothetical protein